MATHKQLDLTWHEIQRTYVVSAEYRGQKNAKSYTIEIEEGVITFTESKGRVGKTIHNIPTDVILFIAERVGGIEGLKERI